MTTNRPSIQESRHAPPGAGADLTTFYEVHDALRRSANALVVSLADEPDRVRQRASALSRWFTGLTGELAHHHKVEDEILFPALAERVPTYAQYGTQVNADHDLLDALIEAMHAALQTLDHSHSDRARAQALSAATELRDHLTSHLDFEDDDVVPMFERHFSADEYAVLNDRVMKSINKRQALFTVPWFMATTSPETAERTLAEAPTALRIMHRLTRRRYARLVHAAFGADSELRANGALP